MKLQRN